MVNAKNASVQQVVVIVLMITFGGLGAITGLIYDFVRSSTSQNSTEVRNFTDISKPVGTAIMVLFAINIMTIQFSNMPRQFQGDMPLTWMGILLGPVVFELVLRRRGIFVMSLKFWRQQGNTHPRGRKENQLEMIMRKLITGHRALGSPAAITPSKKITSQALPRPSRQYGSIKIDRSGDSWRVRGIMLAFVGLLLVLGYFWLDKKGHLDNPEAFIQSLAEPEAPPQRGVRRMSTPHP